MVLPGGDCVKRRSYERWIDVWNEGGISRDCQCIIINGGDATHTRNGWQASKAARNDLGPDILLFPKSTPDRELIQQLSMWEVVKIVSKQKDGIVTVKAGGASILIIM